MSCHHPGPPRPYHERVPRVLLPSLLAAALLTSGCGGVDAPPSAAEHSAEPRATGATQEPTTSTPTEPSSPASRGGNGDGGGRDGGEKVPPTMIPVARPDGSRTHLLSPDLLPAYAADASWTTTGTGPERTRPVGACQKATLVDIGALHAVRRGYAGPAESGTWARQVVARFADAKSAWRAHEVLRSWRDGCEKWLDAPNPEVGPMEDLELSAGSGGHYRAVYGPKKDTDASGLGIVRKGRWLSIVAITATDADFSTGWTRRAVRRIAATFTVG